MTPSLWRSLVARMDAVTDAYDRCRTRRHLDEVKGLAGPTWTQAIDVCDAPSAPDEYRAALDAMVDAASAAHSRVGATA